jgi:hypothetical protein
MSSAASRAAEASICSQHPEIIATRQKTCLYPAIQAQPDAIVLSAESQQRQQEIRRSAAQNIQFEPVPIAALAQRTVTQI